MSMDCGCSWGCECALDHTSTYWRDTAVNFTALQCTTAHYTKLHYITVNSRHGSISEVSYHDCANQNVKISRGPCVCTATVVLRAIHYPTLLYTAHDYTKVKLPILNYATLHYTTQYNTTLRYATLHYPTLCYTTLHYTTLQLCVEGTQRTPGP